MIEGCPPFPTKPENEVPKLYVANERPPFRAPAKQYAHGLKELIQESWSEEPFKRPTFGRIIKKLEIIHNQLAKQRSWKARTLKCLQNLEAMLKRDRSRSRSSRSTVR